MSLQSTDQIADLITRIRNAIMVNKNEIVVPASKLKIAVLEGLKRTNFIADYSIIEATPRNSINVIINQINEAPRINEITKVSKPGRRVYAGVDELPKIKSGRGIVLISTSKGVMTGDEAKKARLGGEILVKVWESINLKIEQPNCSIFCSTRRPPCFLPSDMVKSRG